MRRFVGHGEFGFEQVRGAWMLLLALVWVFCSSAMSSRALAAGPFIIEQGKPRAQIVIAPAPPRTVAIAAQELQATLKRMTGAELPIVTKPHATAAVQIFVGPSSFTEARNLSVKSLKHGAFRIASGDNWLALLGNDTDYVPKEPWGHDGNDGPRVLREWDAVTHQTFGNAYISLWRKYDAGNTKLWEFDLDNAGTFNAVTRFLMDQGARWYMPGELGEFIPKHDSIALPKIDQTVTPDFPLRNIYQMGANFYVGRREEILWQLRLGTNQGHDLVSFGPNIGVAHGIKHVISRDEVKQAHPEMYRMLGRARQPEAGVPCLGSEELLKANVQYLRAWFDQYDVPMASVMPTDGFTNLCECDKCAPQGTPDRGRRGALSDYVWTYVVRVANELAKTHPNRKIQCLAYTTYQLPPLSIAKLPPNVVVGIAQNRSDFRNPELKALQQSIRDGWQEKITSGIPVYQYEYYLQEWPSRPWTGLPVLYPRMIVDDLRSLKGRSIGDYIEAYRTREPQPTTLFNIYITARYYWDVNQDYDALSSEYFRLMFGPAEKPVRAFYELAEDRWYRLESGDIEKMFALLKEAKQLAGESDYGRRVELIRAGMEPGLNRHYAKLRQPDRIPLPRLDVAGLDPSADAALLPQRPLLAISGDGKPVSVGGNVALAWTDKGLLVRVACDEPDMKSLRMFAEKNHDSAILRDDQVSIVLGTAGGSNVELLINPAGVWAGFDRSKSGLDGLGWNPAIHVSATRQARQWAVEVMIPPQAIKLAPPTEAQPWRINVGRVRPRHLERELSSLFPTSRSTLNVPDRMVDIYIPKPE